ncbi:hypothetical protein POM88_050247 [Heracleum sosnowskyi]|uniref:DUF7910 domain-containing protein n=1 Tax=Heracleum sosnowskyi TaxID=360622 RepID=A0AAD8GYD6_9APIA|nr:hypothetical protein POM88_050247 [Heracleum sosnowskyi]
MGCSIYSGAFSVVFRSDASGWETFTAWRINETSYQLRVFNKQFIGVDKDANNVVLATTTVPGESQIFQIVRNSDNANRVKIKASNGFFLQVMGDSFDEEDDVTNISDDEGDVEADCEGNTCAMEGACAMEDAEGDLEGGDGESEGECSDSEED